MSAGQTHQTLRDTIGWESVEVLQDEKLELSGADLPNFNRHKRVGKCRRLGCQHVRSQLGRRGKLSKTQQGGKV